MTLLDSQGMFDATRHVPEATEAAILAAQDASLAIPDEVDAVVITGAGAGRWSAEVVASVAAPTASVPVLALGQSGLPAFVSSSTLVVDVSSREGTPSILVGRDQLDIGIEVPHARVALGAICASLLTVLERAGVLQAVGDQLDHAVAQLHRRRDALFGSAGEAERLARRIGRLFPLVYGEGEVGRLAASRWKQAVNVNAKAPAFSGSLPDLLHDEIAGFGQHGDVTRQVMCAVVLRHDHEADGAPGRFALLDEVLVESVAAVHEVRASGNGALAQLLDLAYVGDVVSLHLAAQEGLDPGPAPFLDVL